LYVDGSKLDKQIVYKNTFTMGKKYAICTVIEPEKQIYFFFHKYDNNNHQKHLQQQKNT
jgi:hypothetical protein